MIGLEELTAGIAGYLREQLGVAATNRRAEGAVYPCLLVGAESRLLSTASCGRQVGRQVTVTVTCYPSPEREREAGLALADRVLEALAGGFTACGRGFCPVEAETGIDGQDRTRVRLLLEFYDLPEESCAGGGDPFPTMGTLQLTLRQRGEET